MREALEITFLKNTVYDYLIAVGIIVLGFVIIQIVKKVIINRLKKFTSKTNNNYDDFLINIIQKFLIPALFYGAIYIGLNYLTFTRKVENVIAIATTVVITYLMIRLISSGVLFLLQNRVRKMERGEEKVKQIGGLMLIINIVIWALGLVFLFDNMGYDITAIITGLGIGGIAVALAAQNIVGDLFNYFVIFFDRPFEIGDFIIVDDKMGTVDYIGIKTTRVQSLSGEQLVFSNSDLTSSRIHNYKRMEKRRIVFQLRVVYHTDAETLNQIPQILKSIILEQKDVTFDRAHFASFAESSLIFEVVYFVLSGDFNKYMDIQQAINLRIFQQFQEMGVDFAYPTRSLYLVDQQSRKESIKKADEQILLLNQDDIRKS